MSDTWVIAPDLPATGVRVVVCRATDEHLFCHYSDGTYRVECIRRRKERTYEGTIDTIDTHKYIADALANYDSASAKLRAERTRAASAAKYSFTAY